MNLDVPPAEHSILCSAPTICLRLPLCALSLCVCLQTLPPEFDILCTHPMFGPESGKASWQDLPFVYDRVRIRPGRRTHVADCFLQIFEREVRRWGGGEEE